MGLLLLLHAECGRELQHRGRAEQAGGEQPEAVLSFTLTPGPRGTTAAATTARTLCTVVHICTLLSCRIHEIGFRSSGVFLSFNIFEFDKHFIKLALYFAKVFR